MPINVSMASNPTQWDADGGERTLREAEKHLRGVRTSRRERFRSAEPFAIRLARGLSIEKEVGHDLFDAGCKLVWPNPPRTKKGTAEFSETSCDLEVVVGLQVIGLEVKSSENFSCLEDYPYDSVLVGSTRRWATRRDYPWAVVVASRGPKRGRLVIPCRTKAWWTIIAADEPSWAAPRRVWRTWEWLLERLKHPTM
jgi:hypothetical protein